MLVCDLNSPVGRMRRASADLRDKWLETRVHWNDEQARTFEERFLQELAPRITMTVAAIQHLTELLHQAERECEEHPASL